MTFRTLVVLAALCASACSSSDDEASSKAKKPVAELAFRAATAPAGASVVLRAKSLENGKLVLELVGKQLTDLYGVAYRLKYDPAVLSLSSVAPGANFAQSDAISLTDTKSPGLLVGALSLKGKQSGFVADGTVLAVITLTVQKESPTVLEFVAGRSAAVAASTGVPIDAVGWAGGELVLQ